jgi:hypothetical protein
MIFCRNNYLPLIIIHSRLLCTTKKLLASNFVDTVAANFDNGKLSDAGFREFIRRTLPDVIYDGCGKEPQKMTCGFPFAQ